MTPLILASASLSRARLLNAAGVRFESVPANIDEERERADYRRNARTIAEMAEGLAGLKALQVAAAWPGRIILGADQILDFDGEAIGKAAMPGDAASLLRRLRGRTHDLVTAAVLAKDMNILWRHTTRCRFTMRSFSDEFLAQYLSRAGNAIVSAVGAYEIEGLGAQLFDSFDGDYFSVIGLPLLPVLGALRAYGLAST